MRQKKTPDLIEGPEALERFVALTKDLVAVPKTEIVAAEKKDKQKKARAKARRPAAASR